jgi:hypothetical protein
MTRTRQLIVCTLAVGLLGGGELVFFAASPAASGTLGKPARLRQQQVVQVGPGPVLTVLHAGAYRLELRLAPNRASRRGIVAVTLLKQNRPVNGARVRLTVTMLDMNMGSFTVLLPRTRSGTYARTAPVLGMSGRWGWRFDMTPPGAKHFTLTVTDHMGA